MMSALIALIREKCTGRNRWFVMNADEDGYCMDFDRESEADEWMADMLARNPDYIARNGYHVVKRLMFKEVEQLALEAADTLESANTRIAELEAALSAKTELVALYAASLRTLEDRIAAAEKQEPVDFVFPPMPPAIVMHEKLGPLFDRLSMQFYAYKCMSLATPLKSEGLRKDAERYRMIRDFGKDGVDIRPPCVHVHACMYSHPVGAIPVTRAITGGELDAAIDAALAKQRDQS